MTGPLPKSAGDRRHPNGPNSTLQYLSERILFDHSQALRSDDTMAKRSTLLDPPPQDHSKAPIENVLDLTPVVDLGPV